MNKFTDGATESYAELPVPVAYLRFFRGDAKLAALASSDPAAFFGGWRAMVKNKQNEDLPKLPLPIVRRMSEDGKHPYHVYSSNVIEFLPLAHRTRFELRQKVEDETTGRKNTIIRAVSKTWLKGYTPVRAVFGLVFSGNDYAPAVLYIDNASNWISFDKAGRVWNKVNAPEGKALVRRYGTVGRKDKETGEVLPNIEIYGEAKSTPIEAIGTDKPRFIEVTPEIESLWEQSQAWANCAKWNAEGATNEVIDQTAKQKFLKAVEGMFLTNIEIEQILAENGNDYAKALAAVEEGQLLIDLNAANTAAAAAEEQFS